MHTTGDLVPAASPDRSVFGRTPHRRWVWLVALAIGMLACVPLAYTLMRQPTVPSVGKHVGGPR